MADDIFVLEANSSPLSRESIVLETLISALRHRASDQDAAFRQVNCDEDADAYSAAAKFSGAFRFKSESKVIAAGQDAFLALADYYKSAVFVDSTTLLPSLTRQSDAPSPDVAKRIFWSSCNSMALVALSKAAWQSVQLLPGGSRHYFACPPIRLPSIGVAAKPVLIIVHGTESILLNAAQDIAERLSRSLEGRLETYGFESGGIDIVSAENIGNSKALVHVHIGEHGKNTSTVRICDSWISGRSVVQYIPNSMSSANFKGYRIDDGVNGLKTYSVEQTTKAVIALSKDHFLQATLNRVGSSMTSESRLEWENIVDVLVKS